VSDGANLPPTAEETATVASDVLDACRRTINECDREIVRLLHRRAAAALEIGRHKQASGLPFYDAARQKRVLIQAVEAAARELEAEGREAGAGPASAVAASAFPPEGLRRVFQEIMSVCLNMERPTRVGFLGPRGTYTHLAARVEFGSSPEFRPCSTIDDLFGAVDRDWVDYSVVPIENSTGGMVHRTLDMFIESSAALQICSEILIGIHHCLIAAGGRDTIRRIYSHPQGFEQCRVWLRQNLPGADLIEVASTAQGVERAREDDGGAAIASMLAAEEFEMNILEENIEDLKENYTRFLVIGKHTARPSGQDRTSILFTVSDRPGALHRVLADFAEARVNLTKIENRPSRRRVWDYVFFADLEGHIEEPGVAGVLGKLEKDSAFFRALGSYPVDPVPRTPTTNVRLPPRG
jgi:chorismate mutase/prephenate dehydratase